MYLDTKASTERALLTGLRNLDVIRISRSGKWVTFVDRINKATFIVDLTAGSPIRKTLFSNSDGISHWMTGCWWIDPANGDEYVFPYDPTNKALHKVKVASNGTAVLPGTRIKINGDNNMDWTYSVSADGTKLGGAFP